MQNGPLPESWESGTFLASLSTLEPAGILASGLSIRLALEFKNGNAGSKSGTPYHTVGSVTFADAKLHSAQKNWGPDDKTKGAEFARGLYMALNSFVQEKRQDCWNSTRQSEGPRGEVRTAYIVCGGKNISFDIARLTDVAQYGMSETVTVSENLGDPPPAQVFGEKLIHDFKSGKTQRMEPQR
jgi:hypothetical protein